MPPRNGGSPINRLLLMAVGWRIPQSRRVAQELWSRSVVLLNTTRALETPLLTGHVEKSIMVESESVLALLRRGRYGAGHTTIHTSKGPSTAATWGSQGADPNGSLPGAQQG